MKTYTLTIEKNGTERTCTGPNAAAAYRAYDRAMNEGIRVVEFRDSTGKDLRDRH